MTVDVDRVRARLVAMRALLAHLESLGRVSSHDLAADFGLRLQAERALSQVITLATEVNAHVVVRELRRPPADLRSSFGEMAEAGWLTSELAHSLEGSAGLRNVLVHEYVTVDLEIVAAAIPAVVDGYGAYVRSVANRLARI